MSETIAFPIWAAAVAAAVLALAAVLVILRIGGRQAPIMLVTAVVVVGVGWLAVDRFASLDRRDRLRAIEARAAALSAHALAPNSNLACLDAVGGDAVYEACEKALFAGPEQVAAALNYVGARLDLLREMAELSGQDDPALDSIRAPIVRSLQSDRFGFVAQVLMARDGCTLGSCDAFDLLPQNKQVLANMSAHSYDGRVARFAASWSDKSDKPDKPSGPALASQAPHPPAQSTVDIDFPSASSIPAVSIMSNEPGRPGQNGVEGPSRSEPPRPERAQAPPSPPRRPAPKAQAPRREPPPPAAADPFPQPVGSAPQTTGTQPR